jgi:hypothetical protein
VSSDDEEEGGEGNSESETETESESDDDYSTVNPGEEEEGEQDNEDKEEKWGAEEVDKHLNANTPTRRLFIGSEEVVLLIWGYGDRGGLGLGPENMDKDVNVPTLLPVPGLTPAHQIKLPKKGAGGGGESGGSGSKSGRSVGKSGGSSGDLAGGSGGGSGGGAMGGGVGGESSAMHGLSAKERAVVVESEQVLDVACSDHSLLLTATNAGLETHV